MLNIRPAVAAGCSKIEAVAAGDEDRFFFGEGVTLGSFADERARSEISLLRSLDGGREHELHEFRSHDGSRLSLPAKLAFRFGDGLVVDARVAAGHVALVVELPVFVAVAAPPLPGLIVPFIFEAHRDAVSSKSPERLA